MKQAEKIHQAERLAFNVKNIANRLKSAARSYDTTFPITYAEELVKAAEDFLKLK